jgi:O-antigen ligase
MTGSRKTLFVLALIPLMWLIQVFSQGLSKKNLKKIALLLGIIGIFAISAGPFVWSSFVETATYKRLIQGTAGFDDSANIRKEMISDGFDLWQKKPLLGYGISQYRFESVYDTYSHNNYIELLVSGGLVALISYYGVLVFLLFKGRKTHGQARSILFFCLALFLLWDVALVSFSVKQVWLLIGVCSWLSLAKSSEREVSIARFPFRELCRGVFRAQAIRKEVV